MVDKQLNNEHNYHDWKLLFRASRDGYGKPAFYKNCDLINNTICIIESPQESVFGGFTSLPWDKLKSKYGSVPDDDDKAFIYRIRANGNLVTEIYPAQNKGENAIQHYQSGYLSFGAFGKGIFMSDGKWANASYARCEEYKIQRHYLNGEHSGFTPIEIEVYQIQF